jgi:hypothetical protein
MQEKRASGDDYNLQLTIKEDSVAVDITGWTFYLTFKRKLSDSDADAALQIKHTTLSDPTNGITVIPVTAAQSILLRGVYFYDVKSIDDEGNVETLLEADKFTWTDPVTQTIAVA